MCDTFLRGWCSVDNTIKTLISKIDPIKVGYGTLIYEPAVSTRNEEIVIGEHCRIDAFTKLEGGQGLVMEDHVHIASFCHVNIGGGNTILRKGSSMGSGAKTISGGNQPDAKSCSRVADSADQVIGLGTIILEEDSCLYAGAIVYSSPGSIVRIGRGARVGALSLVTRDVPDGELWAGVPAKFIRKVNQ
jgi:acetyltransferase-like isoleucine patch superfamily enzyme